MKTKEQQVEELEFDFERLRHSECINIEGCHEFDEWNEIKQKAKLLKAEIEKGCGEKFSLIDEAEFDFDYDICGCESGLCPTCKNLNERLNKIIGEESKERSEE